MTGSEVQKKRKSIWSHLLRFDSAKLEPWIAFRNSLGVALALGVSFYFGAPDVGLILGLGSLVVSYSDGSDGYYHRGWRMLAAAFFSALAVFVAALSAQFSLLAIAMTVIGAFVAGYSIVLGATVGDIALIGLIMFIIFAVQPVTLSAAVNLGVFTFLGGLFQVGFSLLFWPLNRYNPERRALSRLFAELAILCKAHVQTVEMPLGSSQSIRAQNVLRSLARNPRAEAQRYRSILSQSERMRLTLIYLARLRRRYQREGVTGADAISELFAHSAIILDAGAIRLKQDRRLESKLGELANAELEILRQILAQMRQQDTATLSSIADAIRLSEALLGQLRAVVDLVAKTSQRGEARAKALALKRPLRLRAEGTIATLRANLTFRSIAFRHGLRLAICIAVALVVGHFAKEHFEVRRIYWIPMTVAIVLRPDYNGTIGRSFLRVFGTLLGLGLATVLFHFTALSTGGEIILIACFMFMLRWIGAAQYGIFAFALTSLVVLLFAYTGVNPQDVIWIRGLHTLIGTALALVAYQVWPTWEKDHVDGVMAKMLEAYAKYLQAVCATYLQAAPPFSNEADQSRQEARIARSNLLSSFERIREEPGTSQRQLELLSGMWASSNRFAHAMMALESNFERPLGSVQVGPCTDFFAQTQGMLATLIVQLREPNQGQASDRFDLRAAHSRMVEAIDSQANQSLRPGSSELTLLMVETDRLTNSLNTLQEQISTWMRLDLSRRSNVESL